MAKIETKYDVGEVGYVVGRLSSFDECSQCGGGAWRREYTVVRVKIDVIIFDGEIVEYGVLYYYGKDEDREAITINRYYEEDNFYPTKPAAEKALKEKE